MLFYFQKIFLRYSQKAAKDQALIQLLKRLGGAWKTKSLGLLEGEKSYESCPSIPRAMEET